MTKEEQTMTKSQLIEALIAGHHGKREMCEISKADMEAVVDSLGEIIQDRLAAGSEVPLPGVGKLVAVERSARSGRNPQTGEAIQVPASVTARLKPAKALREALNHG
ncbi:HU family DNA-binding protein [Marinobacter subterrani]|uniref:Viral histone-like protein n=1 Tax=Marinobacter subterrani TaxID=1658765 RepID=A0A0J7J650_9GAMM|nr:HU family DNA-binding protein [Marinobacter subterrani]KMQ74028.1 Bacterial nucleoid DNA-binding protein [Marinobacter subterrani]